LQAWVNGLINAYKAKLEATNTQDRIAADLAAKELEAEMKRRNRRPLSSSPNRVVGIPRSSDRCSLHP
jgi:hypothetical protein